MTIQELVEEQIAPWEYSFAGEPKNIFSIPEPTKNFSREWFKALEKPGQNWWLEFSDDTFPDGWEDKMLVVLDKAGFKPRKKSSLKHFFLIFLKRMSATISIAMPVSYLYYIATGKSIFSMRYMLELDNFLAWWKEIRNRPADETLVEPLSKLSLYIAIIFAKAIDLRFLSRDRWIFKGLIYVSRNRGAETLLPEFGACDPYFPYILELLEYRKRLDIHL